MRVTLLAAAMISVVGAAPASSPVDDKFVQEQLLLLARDYEADPLALAGEFGVEVDGRNWAISVKQEPGAPVRVSVEAREPSVPTFVFQTDGATFRRIVAGDLTAATAMGQARASDSTPMQIRFTGGYAPDETFRSRLISLVQHFWTPGIPETVPYGFAHARTVHGGEAVVLHYRPGHLRSAWYGIKPGQHINREPRDRVNDFDTVVVVLRGGSAKARLGGRVLHLRDRTALRIPAGMAHEFWNPGKEHAEFIMIAFGPSA